MDNGALDRRAATVKTNKTHNPKRRGCWVLWGTLPRVLAGPPNRSGSRNGKRRPGITIPLGRLLWNGPPGPAGNWQKSRESKKSKLTPIPRTGLRQTKTNAAPTCPCGGAAAAGGGPCS